MAKIAIVGGGITGLAAAYFLSAKGHRITVFEKGEKLGGLSACFREKEWSWPLERYYHHYFASDKDFLNLVRDLGLEKKLLFKKPKTSVFVEGKIYRFDGPLSILLFPKLAILDKLRTGLTSLFLKINPFWKPLENISAVDFINKTMGNRTFKLIWEPLLQSKFGSSFDVIPASWFWTRVKKRSFSLGYLEGGNDTLIDSLAENIRRKSGEIFLNAEVKSIRKAGEALAVDAAGSASQEYDRVVVTSSPAVLSKVAPGLSPEEKKDLNSLKSLGNLCLVLILKQSFLADGTYWLNVNDSEFPFVSVVEHTNFMEKKYYGSQVVVYAGGYYPSGHRFFKMKKEEIFKEFLPFLKKINPDFNFELSTLNFELFKDVYSQPVVNLNYSRHLPAFTTSIPGLFWASLHHVYPEDRGVNYAIRLGKKMADEINLS